MSEPSWKLANTYGEGCRVFFDTTSIKHDENIAKVLFRHDLVPNGVDKRTQRPTKGLFFLKSFDLRRKTQQYHTVAFIYLDGTVSDPIPLEGKWSPVDSGSSAELRAITAHFGITKKPWWQFW